MTLSASASQPSAANPKRVSPGTPSVASLQRTSLQTPGSAALSRLGNRGTLAAMLAQSAPAASAQPATAADTRLPATWVDAIDVAIASKLAINDAIARLASSSQATSRNVPDFIAQQGLEIDTLTPRHDSATIAGTLDFFAGVDYADSHTLPAMTTHHIDASRKRIRVRARSHDDLKVPLTSAQLDERIVLAVSEAAILAAVAPGREKPFDRYLARFNSMWNLAELANLSTRADFTLNSFGPRTPKARRIFERILELDPEMAQAYRSDIALSDRIDSRILPGDINPFVSPRLQKLREVFHRVPVPVANASFPAFRKALGTTAAELDPADRDVIEHSGEWRNLTNEHIASNQSYTLARRTELLDLLRTPFAAATSPPPHAPTGGGPPLSPEQDRFFSSITIDGPVAPIDARGRHAQVTLTPRSTEPNPDLQIDSRITLAPMNRVAGTAVSPSSRWPVGERAGKPFQAQIINTSSVTMTARLDLLNEPDGRQPQAPPPYLTFLLRDVRRDWFRKNWRVFAGFKEGPLWRKLTEVTPRYAGGAAIFGVAGELPDAETNPGLTLFVKLRIRRGGTVLKGPSVLAPFGLSARYSEYLDFGIFEPAPMKGDADALTFEVDLIDTDRSTVLDSKLVPVTVLRGHPYTKAQAIARAKQDKAFLLDTSPAGIMGQMLAKGGLHASAADMITAPAAPKIILEPIVRRHDSAAYVRSELGEPDPSRSGFFIGTDYGNSVVKAPSRGTAYEQDPALVVINTTIDPAAPSPERVEDADIIHTAVHESVHATDKPHGDTDFDTYKMEFRAFWMDGRFGPPRESGCPGAQAGAACNPGDCQDTELRPEMPPPGPKSCRARAIFENLYGAYAFVEPAYDGNINGFADQVNNYLIPDGVNLIVSRRLDALRREVEGYTGRGFTAFRTRLNAFVGVGAPPATGVLNADDLHEISSNRGWRMLVDHKFPDRGQRDEIKDLLGIPR